jgi:hypothetical protein
MEKIKFETKTYNGTVTIETEAVTVTDVCEEFRRFMVASGFDYVTYKYLADVYKQLHQDTK